MGLRSFCYCEVFSLLLDVILQGSTVFLFYVRAFVMLHIVATLGDRKPGLGVSLPNPFTPQKGFSCAFCAALESRRPGLGGFAIRPLYPE